MRFLENAPQYDEGDDEQMIDVPTSEVGTPGVEEDHVEEGDEGISTKLFPQRG
jgi:hypothetical protein